MTDCDKCGRTMARREGTPVAVYRGNHVHPWEVCRECYKEILSENLHVHPDKRL